MDGTLFKNYHKQGLYAGLKNVKDDSGLNRYRKNSSLSVRSLLFQGRHFQKTQHKKSPFTGAKGLSYNLVYATFNRASFDFENCAFA